MRIDVYLCDNGYARSRTEAKKLVNSGAVSVNGIKITKASFDMPDNASDISVDRENFRYVSRGGYKLEAALSEFSLSPKAKVCIDIGASSGGFTDCLLQNGAKHVIAVDSGTMQLVESLRNDERVSVMENYNARYMSSVDLPYVPSFAVMDVSFISATYIIPRVFDVLSQGADFVCLIKPQFEVGKSGIGKGGIVKSEKLRMEAIERVVEFSKNCGFEYIKRIVSPILGGDGNVEYLAHFKKPKETKGVFDEIHTDNT
jgi:23S rRNA (cytidine1920-2'-O)/16S rRNA (cytidine1409-2'-O)-methyltransferase